MSVLDEQVAMDLARAFAAATQPESLDIIGPILRDALTRVWPLEVTLESVLGYDPDKSDWSQLRDGDPASDPEDDEPPEFLEGEAAYAAAPIGTVAGVEEDTLSRSPRGWLKQDGSLIRVAPHFKRRVIRWGDR